jgi:hypothetical protein
LALNAMKKAYIRFLDWTSRKLDAAACKALAKSAEKHRAEHQAVTDAYCAGYQDAMRSQVVRITPDRPPETGYVWEGMTEEEILRELEGRNG